MSGGEADSMLWTEWNGTEQCKCLCDGKGLFFEGEIKMICYAFY